MMKRMKVLALLGAGLAMAPEAQAVTLDGTTQIYCLVSGSLSSCASVNASVSGSVLTATVTNLAPGGGYTNTHYLLTAFGFFYTGAGATSSSLTLNPSPSGGWADLVDDGLYPASFPYYILGYAGECAGSPESGCGGDARLDDGDSITLTFDINDGPLPGDDVYFSFRGQEWNDGNSFKCHEGSSETEPAGAVCGPAIPTVVPEPATMALLATGLVGLGGAGLIRRRRKV